MQITNVAGQVLHFDPNRVFMLTGPLPTDNNAAVFYLHGVSPAPIPQLAGTMDAFVPTMPNGSQYVKLNFAKTGAEFYVHAPAIRALNPVPANVAAKNPNANAVISLGGRNRFISQTVDVAKSAIDTAGGSI